MSDPAIVASGLTKIYRRFLHKNQLKTLKSALLSRSLISELRTDQTFTALEDVSFQVRPGSTFGVIGENGSGKSTLLKLVAGISKPTRGSLSVNGRVSALIELGAGFHPEISGRENVAINGIMLGLSKKEIDERFDAIVDFAEMRAFIDAPVKTYSSGMYMRLGFAVAIHVDPEVLLIDEVLAVGDEAFTHKCLDKISELRRRGKTILLVSHSLGLVEKMCDEVLWLRKGKKTAQGDPKRVIDAYLTHVASGEEALLSQRQGHIPKGVGTGTAPAVGSPDSEDRWGSREIEITSVRVLDDDNQERHVYNAGENITVRMETKARVPVSDFVFGIGLFTADGLCIYGTDTHVENFVARRAEGEGVVTFRIKDLALVAGTYLLDVAVRRMDGTPYDHHRGLYSFRVKSRRKDVGVHRPAHDWTFAGGVGVAEPPATPDRDLHEGSADFVFLKGWYGPEPGGRWSKPSASLVFVTDKGGPQAIRLVGANHRSDAPRLRVAVNDEVLLDVLVMHGPFELVSRPVEMPPEERQLVKVDVTPGFVPAEHGALDPRELGLFFSVVGLT